MIKQMRNERNRRCLAAFADEVLRGRGVVVEVGTWIGEGACIFAPVVGKLICIDPWEGHDDAFAAWRDATRAHANVFYQRERSTVAANTFADGSLDAVYIDAAHDYANVRADILAWRGKLKPDGVLCGHDYGPHAPGVIQAVNELCGEPLKVFGETSWVTSCTKTQNSCSQNTPSLCFFKVIG